MISKEEIKKLADLARIHIEEKEIDGLRGEMDSILEYVGQVSKISGSSGIPSLEQGEGQGGVFNILREDTNSTESGTYSKELIAEFPNSENNYLKVKKIL